MIARTFEDDRLELGERVAFTLRSESRLFPFSQRRWIRHLAASFRRALDREFS